MQKFNIFLNLIYNYCIYIIALLVFFLDQITKCNLEIFLKIKSIAFVHFIFVPNKGILFGNLSDLPTLSINILLVSLYSLILYVFFLLDRSIDQEIKSIRVGLAFFIGGISGNIIDKIRLGYVCDFINIGKDGPLGRFYFNISDCFLAIGAVLLFYAIIKFEKKLWFPDDKRGKYLVNKNFQYQYAVEILQIVFSFSIMIMALSSLMLFSYGFKLKEIIFFITCIIINTLTFSLILFFISLRMSNRSAGAIFAFKRYILSRDYNEKFSLRNNDHFQEEYEEIATFVAKNIARNKD
ncbi:MAG: signal peptidase II [Oligoflexia bacterium]|nr:signal peptidase II [Oligoflexia bacterium]